MTPRPACAVLILVVAGLAPPPAAAQGPAQSYVYGQKRFRNAGPPPLRYAAGACVRRARPATAKSDPDTAGCSRAVGDGDPDHRRRRDAAGLNRPVAYADRPSA